MFYCEACRKEKGWPESFGGSFGPCEICGKTAECYDVPSSALPSPKTNTSPTDSVKPITPQEVKKSVKPITPQEVIEKEIPPEIIKAFNKLINENFHDFEAVVKQKDVIALLIPQGFDKDEILKKHWFDIESYYKKAGWIVRYDGPGYCESYDAYFVFEVKRKTPRK